ncbi:Aldo/keto reductase family protein [Shimia gijangensis]|uniref:Aldo/keto reductase family protein n=1 Tax=Shimia gijangensis TaxID=1470563 RepID=A0A1M6CF18_9RHOB|nr:aldo/keto reductase [Shimia gijangensis]SHI59576.1 Aldo/keto reductase family protein [Shimia gijangensis]
MKQRKLGLDGPLVSVVGYGSMPFTNFYGPATDEGSATIPGACVDLGITHVDTANIYGMGRAETVIGDWLKQRVGPPPFTIQCPVPTEHHCSLADPQVASPVKGSTFAKLRQ